VLLALGRAKSDTERFSIGSMQRFSRQDQQGRAHSSDNAAAAQVAVLVGTG